MGKRMLETSDLIAISAAIISVFAIIVSYLLGRKANKTAKKALRIAEFDYKGNITPAISAKFTVMHNFCFLFIRNTSREFLFFYHLTFNSSKSCKR